MLKIQCLTYTQTLICKTIHIKKLYVNIIISIPLCITFHNENDSRLYKCHPTAPSKKEISEINNLYSKAPRIIQAFSFASHSTKTGNQCRRLEGAVFPKIICKKHYLLSNFKIVARFKFQLCSLLQEYIFLNNQWLFLK